MTKPKKRKPSLLRWSHLFIAASTTLPFLLLCILGLVWLYERKQLIAFIIACLILSILGWVIKAISQRNKTTPENDTQDNKPVTIDVELNPEWNNNEIQAFKSACQLIHERTTTTLAWQDLQTLSLEVIQCVASELGGERGKPLDFSAPEALLLVEQTASKYREHIREKLPFAEHISVASMYWLWQKRKGLSTAWKLTDAGRRLSRFATNPTYAILKEVEQLVTEGNSSYLSEQMIGTLQALLLEEVASASVDLYSGRLKFSDAELLKIELESTQQDKRRIAEPDDPLRILVIGQISAGKSSLLNHLLDADRAETDVPPTTSQAVTYYTQINEMPCVFLDSPGIDGTAHNRKKLLEEICDSDAVIWLIRADRPSRSSDVALFNAYQQWIKDNPKRRSPTIVFGLTFIDRLAKDWPFPEHHIPEATQQLFAKAVTTIAQDFDDNKPLPISNNPPTWNLDAIAMALEHHLLEALMVQKNRKRLQADRKSRALTKNVKRGAEGIYRSAKFLGSKWLKRQRGER